MGIDRELRIVYYGGAWPTNIGNAFIDIGSIHSLKLAVQEAKVYHASQLPRWMHSGRPINMDAVVDMAESMEVDFVVVSGMVFCSEFMRIQGPILKRMSSRGVKVIFNGCGGATYDEKEREDFRNFLKTINVAGMISRDLASFENYENFSSESYSGIDCAFFLPEAFSPAKLLLGNYVVSTFDDSEEPELEEKCRIIRAHHSISELLSPCRVLNTRIGGAFRVKKEKSLEERGLVVSDLPSDYLNLYANADAVYTDRVHAAIAALAFGKLAKLYSKSPRTQLFESVGASAVTKKLTSLDTDELKTLKIEQVKVLRKTMEK